MNRDTVIGIVGAVILVAAMVGVFQYERTRAPTTLGGDLVLDSFEVANETGSTTIGANTEKSFNVSQANMTNVTFTLTWRPTATGPAPAPTWTLELAITPPAGVNVTGEAVAVSGSGTAEVKVMIPNAKPTDGPLTMGTGEWTAKVTFVSSSTAVPPGTPLDETASWTLVGTAQAWEPAPAAPADTP